MTREAYWDSFLRKHPSDRFQYLIRYPDVDKALQGVYMDRPPKEKPAALKNDSAYLEFIAETEAKIRADSSWMQHIREKAAKWGEPVDTVIHKDAIWLWEQQNNKKLVRTGYPSSSLPSTRRQD